MPVSTLSPPTEPTTAHSPGLACSPLDRFAALDDPSEWDAFGKPHAETPDRWISMVAIDGMRCAACALTLEKVLCAVPGVEQAEVNAASGRARVVWASDQVRPSAWMNAVHRAGYTPLPALEAGNADRRRAEQRRWLWRWLVAGLCMMQVMMYAWPLYTAEPGDISADEVQLLRWASWVLTLPVLLFSCTPFFASALRDLTRGRIGMDVPVALGMAITFAVSSAVTFDAHGLLGDEVYFDSLCMFAFFLLSGRWLEARLKDRTAGSLEALMNRLPETVLRRVDAKGARSSGGVDLEEFERVAVRRLVAGDLIRVLPGEAFPADGTVQLGETSVDEALLTGEASALERGVGSAVIAGSHNLTAPVEVRVERVGTDTRFAQIARLMQQAAVEKPPIAQLADRVARPFLLGVLAAAAFALWFWWPEGPGPALMVATAVLIVTCPCALSLATPAAMLAAAGALARRGVLVRRLSALEALAQVDTIVFDKTGTLTSDSMELASIETRNGVDPHEALAKAAALADQSRHPVSRALVAAALERRPHGAAPAWQAQSVQERAGRGVRGQVAGGDGEAPASLRLGSAVFCDAPASALPDVPGVMPVHLADESGWLASFRLVERLRGDAAVAVDVLRQAGLATEILSGDTAAAARRAGQGAGIDRTRGGCSPQDKLEHLQALQRAGRRVAMVGDGLNDGPVLAAAHVSFALGHALPLAQAQADFVVPGEQLAVVSHTVLLARRTLAVVRQNLIWAAAYNAVGIPLAVAGYMPPWLAGLGMAASSLMVVANAARLSGPAHGNSLTEPN
ncbi:MAG: cation-translocating P-type ATPase [Burkholderiales bacterium]